MKKLDKLFSNMDEEIYRLMYKHKDTLREVLDYLEREENIEEDEPGN